MNFRNASGQHNYPRTCDQCGLPYSGGVEQIENGQSLHFCCYGCSLTHSLVGHIGAEGAAAMFLARLGFSAFLSMNVMALSWAAYDPGWFTLGFDDDAVPTLEKLLFFLSLPVMIFLGYPFAQNAFREAKRVRLSIDALIALGSFAAFGFSTYRVFSDEQGVYFDTATMTLVLVTAGRYLEAHAKLKTTDALRKLLDLQPKTARILKNGVEDIVPAEQAEIGSVIKILPGEHIPLDAVIMEGATSINESVLIGEPAPVRKKSGDIIYAATTNIDGAITARVTAAYSETSYSQVVRLMEEAQQMRSNVQLYVDKLAAQFIPIVMGVAVLTFAGWAVLATTDVAILHSLTVLVVACPCALGIGAPLATTVALERAASSGILVRSTAVFETLAGVRTVGFDKTGTVTFGKLAVTNIKTDIDENRFLSLVASLETNSEHPLGKAIAKFAENRHILLSETRNVNAIPGLGIEGEVRVNGNWKKIQAGAKELFPKSDIVTQPENATAIFVGCDGNIYGSIALQDTVRERAREAVTELHNVGIKTTLLSGDATEVTETVRSELHIQRAYGKLMPADKLGIIESFKQEGTVAMVGDGINDAPSLAAADVGVTLGSATDIAKESADVTILGDHLEKLPWLIRFSRRTLSTIRWNLFWAFAYNAVGIALAVIGLLHPIVAALAMVGSSLFTIVNSRRLGGRGV
ncbi:MAG: cation-translocating P-type ATPase [Ignavibacteriae bacterium]|nr:cation-translocating P-type ATPase [Ignavibacteriota bacterium]